MKALLSFLLRFKYYIIGFLTVALVTAGAVFSLRTSEYKRSPLFYFENLQAALLSSNVSALAQTVDFRSISEHLARETAKAFPFFHEGPHQIDKISTLYQTIILKRFKNKPDGNEDAQITDEAVLLAKPVYILPPNLLEELLQGMQLSQTGPNTAVITTAFTHPLLRKTFPVVFGMQKISDTWEINDILNAQELVETYRYLLEARIQAQHNLLINKHTKLIKQMADTLRIHSCSADAGLLSDRKTLLLVVQVIARNTTTLVVKNENLAVDILNGRQECLLRRNLNAVDQVGPSADHTFRWTIELDGESELGKRILAGPLTCHPFWRTLALSNSRVIHAEDPPGRLLPCSEHHGQHIQGLCKLDLFKDEKQATH